MLEQHKDHSTSQGSKSKAAPLKFQVSHGADKYLLAYRQNSFEVPSRSSFNVRPVCATAEKPVRGLDLNREVPYWRIMLDTYFTFLANRTTMWTDMLSHEIGGESHEKAK